MTATTKKKTPKADPIPDFMKAIVAPVGEDGLNEHDRKKLSFMATHRKPGDLKAAYTEYRKKLTGLSEEDYLTEAKDKVWLSAYANNNPRSDYHWMCDLCYDEAVRRGGKDAPLYDKAHKAAMRSAGY